MTWKPTTRGVTPSEQMCHYGPCKELNRHMGLYVVDARGVRYFCQEHWEWISIFINIIKKCRVCRRNHRADLYKDSRTMSDIKYRGRWWDICKKHFEYYDGKMCSFIEGLNSED